MKDFPDPTDTHVGARVRMGRLMLGISQTDLAEAVGVTFQQVQKYEKGKNRISASRLQQMSRFAGTNPLFLRRAAGPRKPCRANRPTSPTFSAPPTAYRS